MDKNNIAKNKAHNVYPPSDPVVSLSGTISNLIGSKLQAVGPFVSVITNKLAGASSGGGKSSGFNFGALLGGGGGAPSADYGAGASVGASFSGGY